MTRMVRWNQSEQTNYSSFILPIIIAAWILILIIKLIFSSWGSSVNRTWDYLNISASQENSKIYIYMSWDSKKEIDQDTKMYSTDNKLEVESWEAKITTQDNSSTIYIDKRWEMRYGWTDSNSRQVFEFINSQFFAEIWTTWVQIKMKNFTVDSSDSVIAFSQNMVASNIFVLKWTVKITLNTTSENNSVDLWVGQKLTILNNDLKDEKLNLSDKIEPIDDIFKEEDFFVRHNWPSYLLSSSSQELSWSWLTSWSWSSFSKTQKVISFTYPTDESSVEWSLVDVEWMILSDNVEKITLNDKDTLINKAEKKFSFKWFNLASSVNNVVYKVYDSDANLLAKWVIVVYSSWNNKKETNDKPTVTTFPINDKDFKIIEPTDNPYKTSENVVKIVGQVNKWAVKYITINGFRLTKFPQFWTVWYYFANKDYGTMNDGINLYNIKYYWENDNLLFTNLFTIVKENAQKEEKNETLPNPSTTPQDSGTWASNNS